MQCVKELAGLRLRACVVEGEPRRERVRCQLTTHEAFIVERPPGHRQGATLKLPVLRQRQPVSGYERALE